MMQSSWLSCAKSDCPMSKNRTAHNRKPHAETNRWGTIPQSAKLTAPFTQRGLWCGGIQRVRWKIETAVQEPLRQHSCHLPRRRKVRELRFRLKGEKLRSLPCSSFPHRTRLRWASPGPHWGEARGSPCKGECHGVTRGLFPRLQAKSQGRFGKRSRISFRISRKNGRTAGFSEKLRSKKYRQYHVPRNHRQYHGIRLEHFAEDFASEKGSFSQEYFVYFKKAGCVSGGKDRL